MTLPGQEAVNISNYFLSQKLMTFPQVFAAFDGLPPTRGALHRWLTGRLNIECESPLETLGLIALCGWEVPRPSQQVWIDSGYGPRARVDFCWFEQRVIVEANGAIKYSGQYGDPAEVITAERARQRGLERLGWQVIRVEWKDLAANLKYLRQKLWDAG